MRAWPLPHGAPGKAPRIPLASVLPSSRPRARATRTSRKRWRPSSACRATPRTRSRWRRRAWPAKTDPARCARAAWTREISNARRRADRAHRVPRRSGVLPMPAAGAARRGRRRSGSVRPVPVARRQGRGRLVRKPRAASLRAQQRRPRCSVSTASRCIFSASG